MFVIVLFRVLLVVSVYHGVSSLCAYLEHRAVSVKRRKITHVVDGLSLQWFKIIRYILFFLGAAEFVYFHVLRWQITLMGLLLLFLGVGLRLKAIKTLGDFWSFHVVIYENQKLVREGVYRYFSHPAYIGNIYLFGIFLISNSIITAILSSFFIFSFYIYRSRIENTYVIERLCA